MARRSETPGLIRRQRAAGVSLYWSAASLAVDLQSFPDRLIRLPADATPEEIRDLCETYTARLDLWLAGEARRRGAYNGTVGSLCEAFECHPQSPIHEVKRNTAESYLDSLKVIRTTVGARAVRAIAPLDVKGWYANWKAPAKQGGTERITRAHNAVAALRMILRFGASMGFEECAKLATGLSTIQFGRAPRREGEMTPAHVQAFITTALGKGNNRNLYMAIGVATQFETLLRQKDVIGEWSRDLAGRESWAGAYTWENIPGGILRLRTSKTKAMAVHDLTRLDMLWPLLQMVPQADRRGAIVKGEHGLPIRERTYRKWFRPLAREAGIPDNVWNMDSRAGGVTEALEAGAEIGAVQRAATHSSETMTRRYERNVETAFATVADARTKARRGK